LFSPAVFRNGRQQHVERGTFPRAAGGNFPLRFSARSLILYERSSAAIFRVINMATKANSGSNQISQEAVARRAYELWEAEGRPEGRAMEHWTRAESMLRENGPAAEIARGSDTPRARKPAAPRASSRREKTLTPVS
jgi:hypothetical protein